MTDDLKNYQLGVRARNGLSDAGITSRAQLEAMWAVSPSYARRALLRTPNVGHKTVNEIEEVFGLRNLPRGTPPVSSNAAAMTDLETAKALMDALDRCRAAVGMPVGIAQRPLDIAIEVEKRVAALRALTADAGAQTGETVYDYLRRTGRIVALPSDPVREAARAATLSFVGGKARTPFGLYAIGWRGCSQCDVDYGVVTFNGERVFEKHGAEPDELVVAAQADYKARILSALATPEGDSK